MEEETVKMREKTPKRRFLTSEQFTTKEVLAMLVPLVFEQLSIYGIMLLTTSMISSSGQDSVTAVSLTFPIAHLFLAFFSAFATGGAIVIAQYKGHGDAGKVKEAIGQTVHLVMVMGFVMSVIPLILAKPIVHLLFSSAEKSVIQKCELFLAGMAINNFIHALRCAATAGFRGLGDVKPNFVGTIIINFSYFIFSYIFLNLLHLDIQGTLLSYFLARFLGLVHSFLYLFVFKKSKIYISFNHTIRPKMVYLRSMIKLGIPFSFEETFFQGGAILVSSFMVLLGTVQVAAHAIVNSIFQTIFAPTLAVGLLSTTIIGQCIGAEKRDLAKWYGKRLVFLGYVTTVLVIGIMMMIMKPLVGLYHPTEESLPFVYELIKIGLIETMLIYPVSFVLPYVLRAAGDAYYTSLVALIAMWVVRVGLGYVASITLGYGIQGIWILMGAEWVVRAICYTLRMRGNRWLSKKTI